MQKNEEISLISKVSFEKFDISRLAPYSGHSYFPEGATNVVLFRKTVHINDRNLIIIVEATFDKIAILSWGP